MLTMSALSFTSFAKPPTLAFTNYEVARSYDSSFAGASCPNGGSNCWNWNGEPSITTAPDGTIYATSENTAFNHPSECQDPTGGTISQNLYICGGTGAWKSTDGGAHFSTLTSPNVNYNSGYHRQTLPTSPTQTARDSILHLQTLPSRTASTQSSPTRYQDPDSSLGIHSRLDTSR